VKLAPLHCDGCSAPLPLAVPQARVACPFCGHANALPEAYVQAAAMRQQEAAARRAAEPLWRRLARPRPRGALPLAVLLVILLPPLATLVGSLVLAGPLGQAAVVALFSFPALLPGAGLWVWAAAVGGTVMRFTAALAARPPKGKDSPPRCRDCGAPLALEQGALSATCGYCGADSLIEKIETTAVAAELKEALRTLAQANGKLRLRRAILGLGTSGVVVLLGGASALLWWAMMALG